ncbi:MAG: NAD-dependent epimerase/dehydratase family protein [Acidimicrobiales bacterium]|jgi:nucleoside-diphosphate-sugar epimerase
MGKHVIVGAGPVGTATAAALVDAGHEVVVVTRSGSGTDRPGATRVACDASDPQALAVVVGRADALYNCANPPYHRWPELWPPLAASLLEVAGGAGAVLVTMGNLYGYGPVDHPMTEDDPLASTGAKGRVRVGMWADALAAHRDGRVRVTEARASDFYGPGVVESSFFGRNVEGLLAGRKVRVLGDPDAPHSWTYVPDVGRTLAVLGTDDRAWGRAWHVPTGPAVSQRRLSTRFCEVAGAPPARIGVLPPAVLTVAGLVSPQLRELRETRYQFDRPFVLDSSACTDTFGIEPTPLDEGLAAVAAGAGNGVRSAPAAENAAGRVG